MGVTFETYEDRPSAWTGLQLLAASLGKWGGGARLRVWGLPHDSPVFRWLSNLKHVTLINERPRELRGWSVKPWVLLQALELSEERANWIDSDIIATPRFRHLLRHLCGQHLIATEEIRYAEEPQGSLPRTTELGLEPDRQVEKTVNTSLVSVRQDHRRLLQGWMEVMEGELYRRAQSVPFQHRPLGLRGDQDVLTTVLGAKPFGNEHFKLLKEGREIAHCHHSLGFSTFPRLRALARGLPPLVHAQGEKPWNKGASLSTQLSPYGAIALRALDVTIDGPVKAWAKPKGGVGKVLDTLTLGHPVARGLPLTLIRELQWHLRRKLPQ